MPSFLTPLTDPVLLISLLPLVGMAALQSFAAIWAATSNRHWFWRGLALWAAIALLVPIEAWDPAWISCLSSALTVGTLRVLRPSHPTAATKRGPFRSGTSGLRFTLSSLFLLILLISLWLITLMPIVKNYRPNNWWGWLVGSIAQAIIALLTYHSLKGPRPKLSFIGLVLSIPLLAALVVAAGDLNWSLGWYWPSAGEIASKAATGVVFAAILALLLIFFSPTNLPATRARLAWRGLAATFLMLLGINIATIYGLLLRRTPPPAKYEQPANNYTRISEIVARIAVINPSNSSRADLRTTNLNSPVAQELDALYAELLPLLRNENAVAYDPARDANDNFDNLAGTNTSAIQCFRILARGLQAEGDAALVAGRHDEAADYALANIQFGDAMMRGGTMVHSLVGMGLQGAGVAQISRIRGRLTRSKNLECIKAFSMCLRPLEHSVLVNQREIHFNETVYGWPSRYENALSRLAVRPSPGETIGLESRTRTRAFLVLLRADFACRIYSQDHDRFPTQLADLVPDYLPTLPLDAYTGDPLRYSRAGDGFTLYSVGRDRHDDGGRFTNSMTYYQSSTGYDLDLDTLTRP